MNINVKIIYIAMQTKRMNNQEIDLITMAQQTLDSLIMLKRVEYLTSGL